MSIFDHIHQHRKDISNQITSSFKDKAMGTGTNPGGAEVVHSTEELEKGGEGSRGGKIIGHTSSGKAIYNTNGFNIKHKNFTPQDHHEAAQAHKKISAESYEKARKSGPSVAQTRLLDDSKFHQQFANEHHKLANEKNKQNVEKFLSKFPDKPLGWQHATGEIADMHKDLAERYNGEHEGEKDFKPYKKHEGYSKTPEEHNRRHKEGVKELYDKIGASEKRQFHEHHKEWLDNDVEKSEFMTPLEHQGVIGSQITNCYDLDKSERLEKGGKHGMIGETREHNGKKYKKVEEGKWVEVSKSHGMTKKEHKEERDYHSTRSDALQRGAEMILRNPTGSTSEYNNQIEARKKHDDKYKEHTDALNKLSDKEHSDEEVGVPQYKIGEEATIKRKGLPNIKEKIIKVGENSITTVTDFGNSRITKFEDLE